MHLDPFAVVVNDSRMVARHGLVHPAAFLLAAAREDFVEALHSSWVELHEALEEVLRGDPTGSISEGTQTASLCCVIYTES